MFQQLLGKGLSQKVSLYIPGTVNVNEAASQELIDGWVTAAHTFLAGLFGGATSLRALGSYIANDGTLVTENITVIYAYASKVSNSQILSILDFVHGLKTESGQESIGVEVNGTLYFG